MAIELTINNEVRTLDVEPDTPLLWVLRDTLELTGTKYSCGVMTCGACTVLVDGVATRTCALPVSAFNRHQNIVTIEALTAGGDHPVQKAWARHSVAQCGYCQSGMVMAATALLEKNPNPSEAEIDQHMSNLCRCGTYQLVRTAIKDAAEEMRRG